MFAHLYVWFSMFRGTHDNDLREGSENSSVKALSVQVHLEWMLFSQWSHFNCRASGGVSIHFIQLNLCQLCFVSLMHLDYHHDYANIEIVICLIDAVYISLQLNSPSLSYGIHG